MKDVLDINRKIMSVPVLMYHSVGITNKKWLNSYLTCPYEIFENNLVWMKKKRFQTISLTQLYDYMKEGIKLPKKSVVITFDDGYLDNWVFAYPLLKKYGLIGTIYVSPEFVDPRNIIRKNLEDVWMGETSLDSLKKTGYLSWKELKEMEREGIINIQSHTMSHTWYPVSDRIMDFRHPGDPYIWATWNANPDKKPYLQIDDEDIVNFGEPVYEYDRAIRKKRYFPDENLSKYIINYVETNGNKNFFKYKKWRSDLYKVVKSYKEKNSLNDRFETEEEYTNRIFYELNESKKIINNKLDKELKFLCWPGGSVTRKALNMALEVGYISSNTGKDLQNEKKHLRNRYGENPSRINRIGSVLYWDGFGSKIKYKNGFYLVLSLFNFQGNKINASISRLILVMARIYARIF